jgi:hypothetical protein
MLANLMAVSSSFSCHGAVCATPQSEKYLPLSAGISGDNNVCNVV